jgi:hypothetical protein
VVVSDHPQTIEVDGRSFDIVSDENGVAIYEPA